MSGPRPAGPIALCLGSIPATGHGLTTHGRQDHRTRRHLMAHRVPAGRRETIGRLASRPYSTGRVHSRSREGWLGVCHSRLSAITPWVSVTTSLRVAFTAWPQGPVSNRCPPFPAATIEPKLVPISSSSYRRKRAAQVDQSRQSGAGGVAVSTTRPAVGARARPANSARGSLVLVISARCQ